MDGPMDNPLDVLRTGWHRLATVRMPGGARLRAFIRRPGPLGVDGLLALAAFVTVLLSAAESQHYLRTMAVRFADGSVHLVTTEQVLRLSPVPLAFFTALLTMPLAWRRRFPIITFGLQLAGMMGITTRIDLSGVLALILGAYSVAAHTRRTVVALVVLACANVVTILDHPPTASIPAAVTQPTGILLLVLLVGRSIGTWRVRVEEFRDRALRAERERETALRLAIVEERGRIARELHDVISHNVNVMTIQSGAARKVLEKNPDAARTALLAVETSGREAMDELRHLLGVLTPPEDEPDTLAAQGMAPLAPQPGLDQLTTLIDRVSATGQPVRVQVTGQVRPLPRGVDLAAYRVVQEALTNSLKYAPGARTHVAITYGADNLTVEVLDEGAPAGHPLESATNGLGAGRGLLGLSERLSLYGGELVAGRSLTGGYRIHATIPVATP